MREEHELVEGLVERPREQPPVAVVEARAPNVDTARHPAILQAKHARGRHGRVHLAPCNGPAQNQSEQGGG